MAFKKPVSKSLFGYFSSHSKKAKKKKHNSLTESTTANGSVLLSTVISERAQYDDDGDADAVCAPAPALQYK